MNLQTLSYSDLTSRLRHQGIILRTGPFHFRIHSNLEPVAIGLHTLYDRFPLGDENGYIDFDVQVRTPLWRRLIRSQAHFLIDDHAPFKPLPGDQAFAMLEWGLNYCVYAHAHQYLIIHAAVLERNGQAVILAAPPGSGKSTLAAALACRGWRLLSDELTLIDPSRNGQLVPLARPVSLKNDSIDVIRRFHPSAVFGPLAHDTSKGTVSHLRPPDESVARMDETATASHIIFPQYSPDATTCLEPLTRGDAFMQLAENTVNYSLLGEEGFIQLADRVENCICHHFRYSQLEEAVDIFHQLSS
ncbi:HprK-related kinase A [Thiohalophilus sp.]|uniref:HprK-related kinase A n=1 Tax=Thiohalophilus sp. TaxID=3028392 RepID=UPI002ACE4359|nr:HprK-related kinase A [Thiohalophilus sp.]MDZ7803444.1 HprK-related kinase A [Thiohalophilus sp.]